MPSLPKTVLTLLVECDNLGTYTNSHTQNLDGHTLWGLALSHARQCSSSHRGIGVPVLVGLLR